MTEIVCPNEERRCINMAPISLSIVVIILLEEGIMKIMGF